MPNALDIKLSRFDRVYRPNEVVKGVVMLNHDGSLSHQGITLKVEGCAKLKINQAKIGLLDTFSGGNIKPLELISHEIPIASPGKIAGGHAEIPFEFAVTPLEGQNLYESYHGMFINVTYLMTCECKRGMLKEKMIRQMEFIVEVPTLNPPVKVPDPFTITPNSLTNVKEASGSSVPDFRITGRLHKLNCPINEPFTGEIVVEDSKTPIRSIELQLVRIEDVSHAEGSVKEKTEIQNLQLGSGDVARNLTIPIYMIFPRLFTCPTMITAGFKVEFEINLIILFAENYMVQENFPITLYR